MPLWPGVLRSLECSQHLLLAFTYLHQQRLHSRRCAVFSDGPLHCDAV
jgi:hypothetical protein